MANTVKNSAGGGGSLLSIAVVGLGGIGSAFAFKLAQAGHSVAVIARPGSLRLEQLQRDQGIVLSTGGRVAVKVADALDEQVPYDLVLVTVLAHQIPAILPSLQRCTAKCVHFMFNQFNPEGLRDAVGEHRCTFGMPFVMAHLDQTDGKLHLTIQPGQKCLHSDPRWVDLFCAAGLPSVFEARMLLWLRCHAPMCIAFESICVAGKRREGGATWSESMLVAHGIHAGFAVIQGLGYEIYPYPKSLLNASPAFLLAAMLWSVSRITSFRNLLATGINECRAMIDVMVAAASEAKVPLPEAAKALLAIKP